MYLKRTPGNILDSYQGIVYDFVFSLLTWIVYMTC